MQKKKTILKAAAAGAAGFAALQVTRHVFPKLAKTKPDVFEKPYNSFLRLQSVARQGRWELLSKTMHAKTAQTHRIETSHGEVKVLAYGFEKPGILPLFMNIHGGGYSMMRAEIDDAQNRWLAENTHVRVISIDYPLAPQAKYPVQLEICYEVTKYYIENAEKYRIDPAKIGVGGGSAGGNMAAVLPIYAARQGEFQFTLQILSYPMLDLATDSFGKPAPLGCVGPTWFDSVKVCYVGDKALLRDPLVSPVCAEIDELRGLPPALIIAAGRDSLYGEAQRYAAKLFRAGVEVQLTDYPTMPHGFTGIPYLRESRDAWRQMKNFIEERM